MKFLTVSRKSSFAGVSGEGDADGAGREPIGGKASGSKLFVWPRKSAFSMCGVGVSGCNGGAGADSAAERTTAFGFGNVASCGAGEEDDTGTGRTISFDFGLLRSGPAEKTTKRRDEK